MPVCKVADTRLANILYNQDVRTVKDLLDIVWEEVGKSVENRRSRKNFLLSFIIQTSDDRCCG